MSVTSRNTYIAPFVNAEISEYLVIEDRFANGRPPLEDAGIILTDRETVNKGGRDDESDNLLKSSSYSLGHIRLLTRLQSDCR